MVKPENSETRLKWIPEVRKQETVPAQNERFGDFIVKYTKDTNGKPKLPAGTVFEPINDFLGVVYLPLDEMESLEINRYSYNSIPKCFSHMDMSSQNASGITNIHEHPYLNLKGSGTAVAFIDSGISYQNELFRDSGGFSRIAFLWDQTLEWIPGSEVPYGRLFTREDLNRALKSEKPEELVPSKDENGHGTALAGIAAGNCKKSVQYCGAAPESSLIVIKLKQAKAYLKEFFLYPPDAEVYQEDDIMFGIAYAVRWAQRLEMPLSICIGVGTSQGAHTGAGPLSQYLDYVSAFSQLSVSVAAGNEGMARHHFQGAVASDEKMTEAELRIGEKESAFTMEFWGAYLERYEISLISPMGEILEISGSQGASVQTLSFILEDTKVLVNYVAIERQTGSTLVYFRFLHPASGIWKIRVEAKHGTGSDFHIWLPVTGLISSDTFFTESSPYNTITSPADSVNCIAATAYQERDHSIYMQASRGFMADGKVSPSLAAPGVGISVPLVGGTFGVSSGTSYSAAISAGAAALLFEWAIIRENQPFFTGINVKHDLEMGALREENAEYPDREWGFGRLNLHHTFEILS